MIMIIYNGFVNLAIYGPIHVLWLVLNMVTFVCRTSSFYNTTMFVGYYERINMILII